MFVGSAGEPPEEPDRPSTTTASKVLRACSFDNDDASFAVVTDASLNACLNWLWRSGSPLRSRIEKTDEESDMNDPREEEGRIIAQSRFYVNEEITREKFSNERKARTRPEGEVFSNRLSSASDREVDLLDCGVKSTCSRTLYEWVMSLRDQFAIYIFSFCKLRNLFEGSVKAIMRLRCVGPRV